jgi:hypothetical protein
MTTLSLRFMLLMSFLVSSSVHGALRELSTAGNQGLNATEIVQFRSKQNLVPGTQVQVYPQKKDGTICVGSTTYSFNACLPSSAMTNAKVLNKGVETTVDLSSFCKINDGANTLLVNRKGLEIKEVLMIEKGTGKSKTIVPIKTDFLGEYDNADLDPEIYKDALLEPPGWNGGRDEGVR